MFHKPLTEIFPEPPQGLDPFVLDEARIPQHVAVIMDGNGRWAKKRALNRLKGHKAGIEAVRETIRCASDCGVRYLTIYSFSTENWKRPEDEVAGLMELFAKTMLAEVEGLHEEGVCVRTIGDISALPRETRAAFDKAWERTRSNKGMTLNVAINYGSRDEILHAVCGTVAEVLAQTQATAQSIAQTYNQAKTQAQAKDQAQVVSALPEITEESFVKHLYTAGQPDPELLIRTSGELRISNFLLWQIAYAEIYVTDVLWPDFDRYEFLRALLAFQARDRRFGGLTK